MQIGITVHDLVLSLHIVEVPASVLLQPTKPATITAIAAPVNFFIFYSSDYVIVHTQDRSHRGSISA